MWTLRDAVKRRMPLPGVPGEGNWRNPKVVMVVQGRSGRGRLQGLFERRAGKTYRDILAREGIEEKELYVTSAVKTKPGVKAPSLRYEVAVWRPVLQNELRLLRPRKLILVGREAHQMWQDTKELRKHGFAGISSAKKKAV